MKEGSVSNLLLKRKKAISLSKEMRNLLLEASENSLEQKTLIHTYKQELEWLHNILFEKNNPSPYRGVK